MHKKKVPLKILFRILMTITVYFFMTVIAKSQVYLSDLGWSSYTQSYLTPKIDKSVDGNPLKTDGVVYARGIGTHANSDIKFNLAGGYTTFTATIGVDDEVDAYNCAKLGFEVFKDDVSIYTSPPLQSSSASIPITLDVTGAMELRLVVNDGGNGNSCDHADWAGALLTSTGTSTDNIAPSVPGGLSSTNIATTSFTLNWAPSTDNTGVTVYEIFKDAILIGTAAATSFNVTGLTPNTSYNITLRAGDAAGNWSAQSSVFNVTTSDLPPVTYPIITARGENAPNELKEKAFDGDNSTKWLDFSSTSWIQIQYASAIAFNQYVIVSANDAPERDPKNWTLQGSNDGTNWTTLATETGQSWTARNQPKTFSFTNATAYAYYKLDITANNGGPIIQLSEIIYSNVTPDAIAPSVPAGLVASAIRSKDFKLTWNKSTDNNGTPKYIVYLGVDSITVVPDTFYVFKGLTKSTTYNVTVKAFDQWGNVSAASVPLLVTTTDGSLERDSLVENFNDGDLNGWNGGSYKLSNVNQQLKVLADKGGSVWSAFDYSFAQQPVDFSVYPYVSFKAKAKFDFNITIGVGNLPRVDVYPKRTRTVDGFMSQEILEGNSQWQEYSFDFTGVTDIDLTKLDNLHFLINALGSIVTPDSAIFYMDDLRIGSSAKHTTAITTIRDISFSAGNIVPKKISFYGLTDGEDNSHPITVTAVSSNKLLIPDPIVNYTYPAKIGILTVTPNNGVTGTDTITVSVAAAGVSTKQSTFIVSILPNSKPTMKALPDILVNKGATIKIPLEKINDGDPDEEQTVSVSAVSDSNAVLPAGNIIVTHNGTEVTGELSITSAASVASGTSVMVIVHLKDNGGTELAGVDSNSYSFKVTIYDAVNHTPTVNKNDIIRLVAAIKPASILLSGISDGDGNTQALTTSVKVLSGAGIGQAYTLGGISNGQAALNFNLTGIVGADTVEVTLTDNGGTGNNGIQSVKDTIIIIANAAPQTYYVDNFDDATLGGWSPDPNAHTLTQANGELHIHVDIKAQSYPGISVDLKGQSGNKYIDISKKKYITFKMKALSTNTNKPGKISIALLDDDAISKGYYNRTLFYTDIPADGLWHDYTINYNNLFYTKDGFTLDSTHIKGLLINIDNDFFNAYKGDYYVDDFKMGDSADVKFIVRNTITDIPDQSYIKGENPLPINLQGISDGNGNATTGITATSNNPIVAGITVGAVTNGSAQLNFTLNSNKTDSAKITLVADNPAITTDIPDTTVFMVYIVDTATAQTNTVTIDLSKQFQTIKGLGNVGLSNTADGFLKTTDHNITMMRVFGDFDDIESQNDNGDPNSLAFENLHIDQSKVDYYKNIYATTNCKRFFYTVLGPAAWLKTNKSRFPDPSTQFADNNHLNPGLYDEYAEFLVAINQLFKEKIGIDLYAISLQNEPQFNEPYPSCQINGDEFAAIIKVVGDRFKKEGITTRIIMPEDVGLLDWVKAKVDPVVADAAAKPYLDIMAVHNYGANGISAGGGSDAVWSDTRTYFESTPARDLWMTETAGFSNKWEGEMIENFLNPGVFEFAPGPFGFSGYMYSAFKYGHISAWVDLETKENQPALAAAFKQYTKFVVPGSVMVDANVAGGNVLSLAFKNPSDNSLSIILYNTTGLPQKVKISGTGVPQLYESVVTRNQINFQPGVSIQNGYYLIPPRSIVTLKSTAAPLPVTLLKLNGVRKDKVVNLTWATSSEQNNAGFYVERADDGIHFNYTLQFVSSKAANGNSNGQLNYSLTDLNPLNGNNYYRLKQIDKDGNFSYSNTVVVSINGGGNSVVRNVYPNPSGSNNLQVIVESNQNDGVILQVMDPSGRVLVQQPVTIQSGVNNITLNTESLSKGIYFLKLKSKNKYDNSVQRFQKL